MTGNIPEASVPITADGVEDASINVSGPHADGEFVLMIKKYYDCMAVSLTKSDAIELAAVLRRMAK
jgi:hypothetical protein